MLTRRLLVVTGKGGVGKTSVAAGLAVAAAQRGRRVLAVELEPTGALASALGGPFEGTRTPYRPVERVPGVWCMSMDPEASLAEYLRRFLKLPAVTRIGLLSSVFDFVADAAPGVREIVTMGKVCFEVRERHYDLVVVDASSTGHVIAQLDAPNAINELVGAGLIRAQTGWMRDLLADPAVTGVVAVSTAEEMPVAETTELVGGLERVGVDLAALVVNRVLPEPLSRADAAVLPRLLAAPTLTGERLGRDPQLALAALERAVGRRRAAEPLMRALLRVAGERPVGLVPVLAAPSTGPGLAGEMATLLSEELDL